MFARLSSLPLFWQVFGTNALVLVLAFLGLVFGPVTVSVPPHATELVVLAAGLLVAAWLGGIIVNLLIVGGYGDIALRDFGLLLSALTLARLAGAFPGERSSPAARR